jgi:hypothetical protein
MFFLFSQLPSGRFVIVRFVLRLMEPIKGSIHKLRYHGWGRKCGKPSLSTTGSASTRLVSPHLSRYTHIKRFVHGPNAQDQKRAVPLLIAPGSFALALPTCHTLTASCPAYRGWCGARSPWTLDFEHGSTHRRRGGRRVAGSVSGWPECMVRWQAGG